MKKSVFATLVGVALGILMMIGVVCVLNMKPSNEEMMAQNNKTTETEIWSEEDLDTEEVLVEEPEESEEKGILDSIISIFVPESEKESESNKTSTAKKESVDYPYYIRVNRQANCVTIYKKDAEGNYTVPVKAMVCSVGLDGKTPLGVGKISDKYAWRALFGDVYGQYAVRFNGHILFHSVPYAQTSKDTLLEGQYNMLGQPASKGCIRLSVIDAKWIYDNCKKGTKVEVYDSPDPGPLGKPTVYQVSADSPYAGWDPTDPDSANPWKKGTVTITGVKNITINQGSKANLLVGVSAKDVDGSTLTVKVLETVDVNVPGKYTITYSATGATGMTVNETAVLTINAVKPPQTEEPETEEPVIPEEPETEQPPVTEEPDTEVPDTEVPDTEVPDTEGADTEMPDTEVPNTEVPAGTEETQEIGVDEAA